MAKLALIMSLVSLMAMASSVQSKFDFIPSFGRNIASSRFSPLSLTVSDNPLINAAVNQIRASMNSTTAPSTTDGSTSPASTVTTTAQSSSQNPLPPTPPSPQAPTQSAQGANSGENSSAQQSGQNQNGQQHPNPGSNQSGSHEHSNENGSGEHNPQQQGGHHGRPNGSGSSENGQGQHPSGGRPHRGPGGQGNNADDDQDSQGQQQGQGHGMRPRPHHRPSNDDDDASEESEENDSAPRRHHRRHSRGGCGCNRRRQDSDSDESDSESGSDESSSEESWRPARRHGGRRHHSSRRHGHRHGSGCRMPHHGPWHHQQNGTNETIPEPALPQGIAPGEYNPSAPQPENSNESTESGEQKPAESQESKEVPPAEPEATNQIGPVPPVVRAFASNLQSALAAAAAAISSSTTTTTRAASGSSASSPPPGTTPAPLTLSQITNAVASAIAALLPSISFSSSSVKIWDALSVYIDFPLSYQQPIQALPFDSKNAITSQTNDLLWANLPSNVRTTLLNQKSSKQIYDLTFCQWNIVASTSSFCNKNLRQILPQCMQTVFNNTINSLNAFNFDTSFTTTGITNAMNALAPILQQLGVPANAYTQTRSTQVNNLRQAILTGQLPTQAQADSALTQLVPQLAALCPPTSG